MSEPAPPGGRTIPGPKGSGIERVPAPFGGPMTFAGLVPDGVTRVRNGNVTADVQDNFFRISEPADGSHGAPAVEWLDDDGNVRTPAP